MMKKQVTAADTKEIALTIYNTRFGVVQERRRLDLTGNETEIIYSDVARQIETESLLVAGVRVREFSYDHDLLDRHRLLKKYIGKEVFLLDRKSGKRKDYRLWAVENDGSCILEDMKTKEIYMETQAVIILPSLPPGLLVKPALVWQIEKTKAEDVQVSYLSQGLNWQANYLVELLEKKLHITGWAKIENTSGVSFTNAQIKLMAGDVQRSPDQPAFSNYGLTSRTLGLPQAAQAVEKPFFDYHMYTLLEPTTLKDNQTKQINILHGFAVPYKRYYRIVPGQSKVQVTVEFANTAKSGLGIPLPQGRIKLYKPDQAGSALAFIGEDKIDHTAKDEDVRLTVGHAFDLAYSLQEVNSWQVANYQHHKFACNVRSRKEEKVELHLEQAINGFWEMVKTSHAYEKVKADQIRFIVELLPRQTLLIEFEYRQDMHKTAALN